MKYFWAYFFQSFGIQVCSLSQKYLWICLFFKFLYDSELPPDNWYFLTVLDRARPCSRYVSTMLEVLFEFVDDPNPCLDHFFFGRKYLRICSFLEFLYDSELPPDNWYFLTVLEVCFDHARGTFRVCRRPKPLSRPFGFSQELTYIWFWKPKHKVSNLTWERNPLSSKK